MQSHPVVAKILSALISGGARMKTTKSMLFAFIVMFSGSVSRGFLPVTNILPGFMARPRSSMAEASAVQSYFYDFESGASGWSLQSGIWSLAPSEGGQALMGIGHGFARLTAYSGEASSLSFRFRLDGVQTYMHVNVFDNLPAGGGRYFVRFGIDGVKISRQQGNTFQDLGSGLAAIAPNSFHEAQIMVGGGSIDVFVDGEGVVGLDDPLPPEPGYISFESLVSSPVYVDDVNIHFGAETSPHPRAPRPPLSMPPGPDISIGGQPVFVSGVHNGDIHLNNTQVLTLSHGLYIMKAGTIYLEGEAELHILPEAVLVFDRDTSPLIHWGVDLKHSARLEISGGNILSPAGTLVRISAFGNSSIVIDAAKPWIHFINAGGYAAVSIIDSRLTTALGGSVQLSGQATAEIYNSKVGAIGLSLPAGSSFTATGLQPGVYTSFDLQNDLHPTGIGYNLIMQNSEILPDTIGEGPFEKGWVIFADESAAVQITNSSLKKFVLEMPAGGANVSVNGLDVGAPSNFTMGSINLSNVTVTGQWGFFIHGSRQATFDNCNALWFFLYDTVSVTMKNSTMNEFDPRYYTGTLTFDNSEWKTGGEIIESNDLVMAGTVRMNDPGLVQSLSWSNSAVTRRYPIQVLDSQGQPVPGAMLTLTRGSQTVSAITDPAGWASVNLRYIDADYKLPWQLTTGIGSDPMSVDFFTTTPILVGGVQLYLPLVAR
jgi:hypothetical protein